MITRDAIYIDGKWVPAGRDGKIEIINPANEQVIGSVPVGTEGDVNAAISALEPHFLRGRSPV